MANSAHEKSMKVILNFFTDVELVSPAHLGFWGSKLSVTSFGPLSQARFHVVEYQVDVSGV
jgi:hypothetical protein